MKRAAAGLAIVVVLAYAGAIVWLVTQETRLVFEAGAPLGDRRPALPFEQVPAAAIAGPRRADELMWVMRAATNAGDRPWVLFLHGNAATVASRMNILHYERLRALGLNVIAPEYRGFAGLEGSPSEASLSRDAHRAYDYTRETLHVDPTRLVIYGWSLGSAVAVNLAAQVDEAAVILEGAPASVVAIGARRYPFFPIRLLIRNPFESIARIGRVGSPVLFLHSPEDAVIPIAEGRRLFAAAPPPKQFVEVTGGHVYASEKDPRFFPAVRAFLQANRLLP
jgi:fermentation-respiration switch protein FrsA (DUF1100 family)